MTATSKPPRSPARSVQIPDKVYFRIGDVADLIGVKPYVLRYWETEFPIISPSKSTSGQRIYKKSDVESLLLIKHLLYNERYSIEGARKRIRELKKQGEFQSFKRDRILGGEENLKTKASLEKVKKLAVDLDKLAKTPVSDLFKL